MSVVRHSLAALLALIAVPCGAVALCLRPAWREGLRERLGLVARQPQRPLWVHAASVGEAGAASPLVRALCEQGRSVFLSATTIAGRELLSRSFPELPVALAPLDHAWCVDAALRRVQPRALVLIETELWPSWIAAAERDELPVVVVSGRISDRSYARSRPARRLLRPTLRRIAAIGARSALDAERFVALGAVRERVSVTGDLKLEGAGFRSALPSDLEKLLGERPLFVAGSTHAGEEVAAAEALAACEAEGLELNLAIAPRRPERAASLCTALRSAGRRVRLRSEAGAVPLAPGEVLVVDGFGELPALYAAAEVAFVGGSFVEVGGHNLLEPLQAGTPVLFGPHVENARDAADLLLRSRAGIAVRDSAELARSLASLIRDRPGAKDRVQAGQRELAAHRGSVVRSLALLDEAALQAGSAG